MAPGSAEQQFEERLARLDQDIGEIIKLAECSPEVVAAQDARTQLFLSFLRERVRTPAQLRVVR